ncbi:MAG: hypothetical protein A3G76_09635 [Acidobacteria bacterium RIFCSPLOWO2_12_FULL_65_11]|nr:MAG: hypothetical protein A3G76_09635 [Acidobacteria bacterium RIFCSPLOWO2_12_FULL_65_11]
MRVIIVGLLATLACCGAELAQAADLQSSLRNEVRLVDRRLPDMPLRLGDGRVVQLSSLWRDTPLLVTFFYQRCTGTCIPSLRLIRDAVQQVGGLGRDYRVLALSFDDVDTVADMRLQADAMELASDPNWFFAVAAGKNVAQITSELDFGYWRDPSTGQYVHESLLVAVDQGRVIRALLGYPIPLSRFRELAWELRGSFVPYYEVPGERLLRCFEFNPRTGGFRPDWGLLLLLAQGVTAIAVALTVFNRPAR